MRPMPMRLSLAMSFALAVVVTGCSDGPDETTATPTNPAHSSAVNAAHDPLDLVGRWHVEVPGEPPGAMSVVLGKSLAVFLQCGALTGQWEAESTQNMFLASLQGGTLDCLKSPQRMAVQWLEAVTSFRSSAGTWLLLDSRGRTLATLRPGATPTTPPDLWHTYSDEPAITEARRAAAAAAARLPAAAKAPTGTELQRRWQPVKGNRGKPFVTFGDDGRWSGSDGCNAENGRFLLGRDGRLLGTHGPSTLIGCDNSELGRWVATASRVGLVDGMLAFYDSAAKELGRATPA